MTGRQGRGLKGLCQKHSEKLAPNGLSARFINPTVVTKPMSHTRDDTAWLQRGSQRAWTTLMRWISFKRFSDDEYVTDIVDRALDPAAIHDRRCATGATNRWEPRSRFDHHAHSPSLQGWDGRRWIRSHAQDYAKGEGISLAITLRLTKTLAGAVGLTISREHDRAELGYWVGKEFWGKGFATEAAKALLTFGFQSLGLNRINARHLTRNPASGRVLVKIGMRHEGTLRQHVKKWGVFEDAKIYGILSSEFKIEAKLPSKMDAH